MDEAELVRKCKKNDQPAQRQVFDCFADRLYRLAFRYLKNQAEAEDVVMVSFTKIFKNIDSFSDKGTGSFEAWMRRIVINEALMCLRRANNLNLTESLDTANPQHHHESFQDIDGEHLYDLILELPAGYRTVFNLFAIEGFEHTEIASMLGISEGTSRSQLFKARQLLKRKIMKEGFQYGT